MQFIILTFINMFNKKKTVFNTSIILMFINNFRCNFIILIFFFLDKDNLQYLHVHIVEK